MSSDLLSHFSQLEDPRVDRTKRYPLIEIIFLIISATISGCEGWKSIQDFGVLKLDWLRQFLPYENGIPVDDTIAIHVYLLFRESKYTYLLRNQRVTFISITISLYFLIFCPVQSFTRAQVLKFLLEEGLLGAWYRSSHDLIITV